MHNYLNYVLSFLNSNGIYSHILTDELNIYIKYWCKYHNDCSKSPLYHSTPEEYDQHCFILPPNEKVFIHWDIKQLYQSQTNVTNYLSLYDFEYLVKTDLENTAEEISRIHKLAQPAYPHKHIPILLLSFKPTGHHLILDGRHRYIEYKKFNPLSNLPVYILDDEQCFTSIIYKKDLLAYIIMHNIEVINNYMLGKESLERLLNLEKCIGS